MDPSILIFVLIASVVVALVIFGAIAARRRREEMAQVAAGLGLSFSPEKDYSLAGQYAFLNQLAQGTNRYAFNVIRGVYQEHSILAFDYHYETHSTDSKGRRQTHHHYFSFLILSLPLSFPEVRIYREGLFSKIGQFLGFDDIDFESAEFSRRFCVRSKDKKLAYDVCNARMMEYLLANDDLSIEIEGTALALGFGKQLAAKEVEPNLQRLVQIRSLLPNYLFSNAMP